MPESRLSGIDTQWSMVRKAHEAKSSGKLAQSQLIERYGPAVKRYLLASLRSEEAADEVFQEFALRLVRGDFKNADSHKGRFRSLIKTALYHLIIDFHRRNQRNKKLGTDSALEHVAAAEIQPVDESFSLAWRETLIQGAWTRLEQLQTQTKKPYFDVLRARVEHPELTTGNLLQHLAVENIVVPQGSAFRVFLHRARRRFAALVLEQVTASLENPTDDAIELELIELGLHHFCKPTIEGSL
jgi:RNA polymerase sigma factor (sigma-70 family)